MSHCAKKAGHNRAKIFYMSPGSPYYKEKGISKTAQREIAEILMREKRNQSHVSGEETVTYKKR